jgi:LuxR family maltose regulon positive regulatory protein
MQSLNKTTWYEGADEFINKETLKTIPGKIVQMRIFLDQHKYEEAIRFLHTFYKQVEQTSFTWWKLELKILLALSYYATKRESKAFPLIHDVLQFASNQEVIRIFVNERELMRSLLCDYMEWVDHEKIGLNQASSDYLKKLMPALDLHCAEGGTIKKEQSPTTISIFPMEEPFSPKEEEIFALLYQGKSAKEIAEIMGVSINTTRTHTKNIYRKFGVHSQKLLIKRAKELEFEG